VFCRRNDVKIGSQIQDNRTVTVNEVLNQLQFSYGFAHEIIQDRRAKWVPKQHTEQRRYYCSASDPISWGRWRLFCVALSRDEIRIRHYEPETRRQNMEWKHSMCPVKRKFQVWANGTKIKGHNFLPWEEERIACILMDWEGSCPGMYHGITRLSPRGTNII